MADRVGLCPYRGAADFRGAGARALDVAGWKPRMKFGGPAGARVARSTPPSTAAATKRLRLGHVGWNIASVLLRGKVRKKQVRASAPPRLTPSVPKMLREGQPSRKDLRLHGKNAGFGGWVAPLLPGNCVIRAGNATRILGGGSFFSVVTWGGYQRLSNGQCLS